VGTDNARQTGDRWSRSRRLCERGVGKHLTHLGGLKRVTIDANTGGVAKSQSKGGFTEHTEGKDSESKASQVDAREKTVDIGGYDQNRAFFEV